MRIEFTKEDHDTDETLDRTVKVAEASFDRLLTPFLSLRLAASYEREEYDLSALENKRLDGTVSLGWRIGRRSEVSLLFERFDQDSTFDEGTFTENRAGLQYIYHVTSPAL